MDLLAVVMAMYSVFGEDCYTHHSEETQLKVTSIIIVALFLCFIIPPASFTRHCWSSGECSSLLQTQNTLP